MSARDPLSLEAAARPPPSVPRPGRRGPSAPLGRERWQPWRASALARAPAPRASRGGRAGSRPGAVGAGGRAGGRGAARGGRARAGARAQDNVAGLRAEARAIRLEAALADPLPPSTPDPTRPDPDHRLGKGGPRGRWPRRASGRGARLRRTWAGLPGEDKNGAGARPSSPARSRRPTPPSPDRLEPQPLAAGPGGASGPRPPPPAPQLPRRPAPSHPPGPCALRCCFCSSPTQVTPLSYHLLESRSTPPTLIPPSPQKEKAT